MYGGKGGGWMDVYGGRGVVGVYGEVGGGWMDVLGERIWGVYGGRGGGLGGCVCGGECMDEGGLDGCVGERGLRSVRGKGWARWMCGGMEGWEVYGGRWGG